MKHSMASVLLEFNQRVLVQLSGGATRRAGLSCASSAGGISPEGALLEELRFEVLSSCPFPGVERSEP